MSLERVCEKEVVTGSAELTLLEAARLMRSRHVGSIVVVEGNRPIGILTDRDIVVKAVAEEKDPREVRIHEAMTRDPAVVNINYDPMDATRIMKERGLRRLPVVDEHRHLMGIVTLDDILGLLGREAADLAEAVHTEMAKESA
ncbi:MAG TPA: CBS domain-containing protein [Candidatus Binatia bacterium]